MASLTEKVNPTTPFSVFYKTCCMNILIITQYIVAIFCKLRCRVNAEMANEREALKIEVDVTDEQIDQLVMNYMV